MTFKREQVPEDRRLRGPEDRQDPDRSPVPLRRLRQVHPHREAQLRRVRGLRPVRPLLRLVGRRHLGTRARRVVLRGEGLDEEEEEAALEEASRSTAARHPRVMAPAARARRPRGRGRGRNTGRRRKGRGRGGAFPDADEPGAGDWGRWGTAGGGWRGVADADTSSSR